MECVDEEKEDDEGAVRAAAVYLRLVLSRVLLRVSAAHDLAEAPIGNIFSQLGNYLVLWGCSLFLAGTLQCRFICERY